MRKIGYQRQLGAGLCADAARPCGGHPGAGFWPGRDRAFHPFFYRQRDAAITYGDQPTQDFSGMSTPSPTTETFSWPVRVYWEDTDAGGIVFYANYLKFFERSRTEWLRHAGFSQHVLLDTVGVLFVVKKTSVEYHAP